MIWFSKEPPIYIFDGDYWQNEKTKEMYYMDIRRMCFVPLLRYMDKIPFTKKTRILKIREIENEKHS